MWWGGFGEFGELL